MKNICLLDLNYTLVGNQADTRMLRPFSRRMEAEEYRSDLIEAIRDDYVIIVTARPDYQMKQTMANIKRKTGWKPQEWYFNDINAEPPVFKESALRRFILPRHGAQTARRGRTTTRWRAIRRRGPCMRGSASRPSPMTASSNRRAWRGSRLSTNAAYSDN